MKKRERAVVLVGWSCPVSWTLGTAVGFSREVLLIWGSLLGVGGA